MVPVARGTVASGGVAVPCDGERAWVAAARGRRRSSDREPETAGRASSCRSSWRAPATPTVPWFGTIVTRERRARRAAA